MGDKVEKMIIISKARFRQEAEAGFCGLGVEEDEKATNRWRFIGFCLGLLVSSFAALPASAQISAVSTEYQSGTSPLVKEILKADQSNRKDPVWPGFNLLDQPILIYEAGVRSFLIAHPNPPSGYKGVQASPHTVFEKQGEVEDLDFVYQLHRDVNGSDTFAFRMESNDQIAENLYTVVHERFHVFQQEDFKGPPAWSKYLEPSAEVLAMAALEQKALEKALSAETPQEVARYAKLFNAIRLARYQGPSVLQEVDAGQERSEGMAEYVTSVLLYRKGFPKAGSSGRLDIIYRLQRFPNVANMKKGRHYWIGTAQGYILDEGGPADWKKRVADGEAPFDIVKEAYPVAEKDLPTLLAKAKSELGYMALLAKAAKIDGEFQKAKARAIADYAALPGIELTVSIPWSPDNKVQVLHSSDGTNYDIDEQKTLIPGRQGCQRSMAGVQDAPHRYPCHIIRRRGFSYGCLQDHRRWKASRSQRRNLRF